MPIEWAYFTLIAFLSVSTLLAVIWWLVRTDTTRREYLRIKEQSEPVESRHVRATHPDDLADAYREQVGQIKDYYDRLRTSQ